MNKFKRWINKSWIENILYILNIYYVKVEKFSGNKSWYIVWFVKKLIMIIIEKLR